MWVGLLQSLFDYSSYEVLPRHIDHLSIILRSQNQLVLNYKTYSNLSHYSRFKHGAA
jgi:hypothetical protein